MAFVHDLNPVGWGDGGGVVRFKLSLDFLLHDLWFGVFKVLQPHRRVAG